MNLTNDTIEKAVEDLEQVIDESTMLGAGWDCLSDSAKNKIRDKFRIILMSVCDD